MMLVDIVIMVYIFCPHWEARVLIYPCLLYVLYHVFCVVVIFVDSMQVKYISSVKTSRHQNLTSARKEVKFLLSLVFHYILNLFTLRIT